jgi:hypothetical protein
VMFKRLIQIISEGPDDRAELRRKAAEDKKSGRMSRLQRVARAWSTARRQRRDKSSADLLSHYKELEKEKKK